MSGQVVDPALLSQLSHDGIYPGESTLAFSPLGQRFWVAIPWNLNTDGVALHFVKARVVGGCCVEELSPKQLAIE